MAELSQLIQLLKSDHQQLDLLEQTLLDEQNALENRELDKLKTISETKNRLLDQYGNHAVQRIEWMGKTGMKPREFLALLREKAPAVYAIYEKTESKLRRVQTLNEINGRILHRTQMVNNRLMDILRGKPQEAGLYGKQGQADNSGGTRLLGEA